jgi:IMP dehydrogenase
LKELLTFDDVLIVPKFSTIGSRKDVSLSVTTSTRVSKDIGANFPVISSNMDTVTGPEMARAMLKYGGQACLHRFCSIEENVKMFIESELPVFDDDDDYRYRPMVSIGLGKDELDRAHALYFNCATRFVIDVAHGATMAVVRQVKALREIIKDNGAIIVGNFATRDSVQDFLRHVNGKIEGIKAGIGPGSMCTTRIKTGIGVPQLSAIMEISPYTKSLGIPVIADGGLKTPGDCAKALGAGADLLMIGGMLAGTEESPGEFESHPLSSNRNVDQLLKMGQKDLVVKKYRGSASKESYQVQGKEAFYRTAEGESTLVPYKGPVKDVLQDIEGGLRSALSYVGARNLEEFHKYVEFVRVSPATVRENGAHGKRD